MAMILTKSVKEGSEREINLEAPAFLEVETLPELIDQLGEDVVFKYAKDQTLIAFRSRCRGLLEAKNEDGTAKYSDAQVADEMAKWKPSLRVAKSAIEKLSEATEKMSAEDIMAALQNRPDILAKLQG